MNRDDANRLRAEIEAQRRNVLSEPSGDAPLTELGARRAIEHWKERALAAEKEVRDLKARASVLDDFCDRQSEIESELRAALIDIAKRARAAQKKKRTA